MPTVIGPGVITVNGGELQSELMSGAGIIPITKFAIGTGDTSWDPDAPPSATDVGNSLKITRTEILSDLVISAVVTPPNPMQIQITAGSANINGTVVTTIFTLLDSTTTPVMTANKYNHIYLLNTGVFVIVTAASAVLPTAPGTPYLYLGYARTDNSTPPVVLSVVNADVNINILAGTVYIGGAAVTTVDTPLSVSTTPALVASKYNHLFIDDMGVFTVDDEATDAVPAPIADTIYLGFVQLDATPLVVNIWNNAQMVNMLAEVDPAFTYVDLQGNVITRRTNTIAVTGVFLPTVGTGTILELALFGGTGDSTMVAYRTVQHIDKAAGNNLSITWNLTF